MKRVIANLSEDPERFSVLVVDRDARALELAASHIEHRIAEAAVSKAQSYIEVRAFIEARKAHVLILDCDGGQSTWSRLLNEFSRSCPEAKIVLTGRSMVPVRERTHILGFLLKPYRVDDLVDLIESARKAQLGSESEK